jgi:hypothetical protein
LTRFILDRRRRAKRIIDGVRGTALTAAAAAMAIGCGKHAAPAPDAGGTRDAVVTYDAAATNDSAATNDAMVDRSGGDRGSDGSSATCAPALPALPWTSPYAAWSRGIPSDPSFFPIAVWLQGSWHAAEMADLGINVYVGNNGGTDSLASADLATLKSHGIYAIVGQDSVGLANIDDPTIVGWWMTPDEPDNAQSDGMGGYGPPVAPATLVSRYSAYKAADPTRPIYLGLGQGVAYDGWEGRGSNAPPESQYVPAADILAFDIYPYNNCGGDANEKVTCGQFWLNAFGVDRLHQWSNHGQAVWTDFETTIIAAGTTTGPTPAQVRSEVWLGLIHGANGVTYFVDSWQPTFREDGIFGNSTMVAAVTALNQQIKTLAPVLNSASVPNVVTVSSSNSAAPIDIMVKAQSQVLYIFAAIARAGTTSGRFAIAGLTGDGSATVVGESRTVPVAAGKLTDDFAANEAHIYEIDLRAVTCR